MLTRGREAKRRAIFPEPFRLPFVFLALSLSLLRPGEPRGANPLQQLGSWRVKSRKRAAFSRPAKKKTADPRARVYVVAVGSCGIKTGVDGKCCAAKLRARGARNVMAQRFQRVHRSEHGIVWSASGRTGSVEFDLVFQYYIYFSQNHPRVACSRPRLTKLDLYLLGRTNFSDAHHFELFLTSFHRKN